VLSLQAEVISAIETISEQLSVHLSKAAPAAKARAVQLTSALKRGSALESEYEEEVRLSSHLQKQVQTLHDAVIRLEAERTPNV